MSAAKRGRLREAFKQILTVEDTPHRIGVAFGLGVFIAMSALLGLHTVLGLVVPQVLRLSKRVCLAGVWINNPWTIVPLYTFCLWVGLLLTGTPLNVPEIDWAHLSFGVLVKDLAHLILPFILGTTVVGLVSGVGGYFVVRNAVIKYRS